MVTFPGEMGETSAREAGFTPQVIGEIQAESTTAEDTRRAVREMSALGVGLDPLCGRRRHRARRLFGQSLRSSRAWESLRA
ncbi:MAG: hypothetical protein MZV64_33485 [Ignavibacteriales bacterium]|nr:hypothetical protein [Ignavibacteriales bacterium]